MTGILIMIGYNILLILTLLFSHNLDFEALTQNIRFKNEPKANIFQAIILRASIIMLVIEITLSLQSYNYNAVKFPYLFWLAMATIAAAILTLIIMIQQKKRNYANR